MHKIYQDINHPARKALSEYLADHPETPIDRRDAYDPLRLLYKAMQGKGFGMWDTRAAMELEVDSRLETASA